RGDGSVMFSGAATFSRMSMTRIHIALAVTDVSASIEDYSRRLGCPPSVVVGDEYALWRTEQVNLSIRRTSGEAGVLRPLRWEDPDATRFSQETDVNGIVWERFSAELQAREITDTWPDARLTP